jgi:ADP-heptose:LPS heptosyltransferase
VSSRWPARLAIATRALARRGFARKKPEAPRAILVVATALFGDVLLLTPLLAKLRTRYPEAALRMTVPAPMLSLYAGRPYGVEARAFNARDARTVRALSEWSAPDLAFVPGENRSSWLAAALGARWIFAFDGDRPAYKSWMVDELVPFPAAPAAWSDLAAMLAVGPPPPPYRKGDWPHVPCAPFERPTGRYAVLHVESSTPRRHWREEKWLQLAERLSEEGIRPLWSAGPKGLDLIRQIDPRETFAALGHKLDLAQLWNLIEGAALLVCPDTATAHMAKITSTPTVTLYGPGLATTLYGRGDFWRDAPFLELVDPELSPRQQVTLFKRPLDWAAPAERSAAPADAAAVLAAARALIGMR